MPFKAQKQSSAEALVLEWILQTKRYKLALDRSRCVGCQICTLACPKAAITTHKQPTTQEETKNAAVDIDQSECNFCGFCDIICPYGAIQVTLNGEHNLAVVEKKSYPQLVRDIEVNTQKCYKECSECETACPLNLITVSKVGYDGKPVTDVSKLSPMGKRRVQVSVDIKKQYCPTCRTCEYHCKPGAITVKKAFEGKIAIDTQKCPEGCRDCLDVCPITGTLALDGAGKVIVSEQTCTFCGACKNVCPVEDALTLSRTKVLHTQVRSGAWNKALARITSPEHAAKEYTAQATKNRRQIIDKRFIVEELKKKNAAAN